MTLTVHPPDPTDPRSQYLVSDENGKVYATASHLYIANLIKQTLEVSDEKA